MKLKRHTDFVNEKYEHTEEEHRVLDRVKEIIMEKFEGAGFNVKVVYVLNEERVKDHFQYKVEASEDDITTFIGIYFEDDKYDKLPDRIGVTNILKQIFSDAKYKGSKVVSKRQYTSYGTRKNDSNAHLFGFNIKREMESNLFRSNLGLNKYNI